MTKQLLLHLKAKEGAWAKVKITYTDEYDRTFEKTVNVTMSDKVATGFDITESALTFNATSPETQLAYTLSGTPEFSTVNWQSSDENVVKVSSEGKLTLLKRAKL